MKKLTKSIVSLALIVVMLVCLCGTAFATYTSLWGSFPLQTVNTHTVHTYAAQAVLFRYSGNTRSIMTNNGAIIGVDGDYGDFTADAVERFQTLQQIGVDRKVGPETWRELWSVLEVDTSSPNIGYTGYCVTRGLEGEAVYRQYYSYAGVSLTGWWARNDFGTACKFY